MPRMLRTFAVSTLIVTGLCAHAALLSAHEGHGHPDHETGVSHYVVNPSHALPIMIGAALIVFGAMFLTRVVRSRGKH
ncbi:MAG: hypothetical protein ACK58L_02650 [Planctomycetota bacterium]